jgi:DNA mismatch endonuclease, patch repair protein
MRRIGQKNTKPEQVFFQILSKHGIPHERHLRVQGVTVDAVVAGRVLVFVDSPLWHLRDLSLLEKVSEYWQDRLRKNRRRDRRQTRMLRSMGYTVVRFWSDELDARAAVRRLRAAISRNRATTPEVIASIVPIPAEPAASPR